MENTFTSTQILSIVSDLVAKNKENLSFASVGFDVGYLEGINDGMLDVLNKLGIKHDFQYQNG